MPRRVPHNFSKSLALPQARNEKYSELELMEKTNLMDKRQFSNSFKFNINNIRGTKAVLVNYSLEYVHHKTVLYSILYHSIQAASAGKVACYCRGWKIFESREEHHQPLRSLSSTQRRPKPTRRRRRRW